jgi:hypothetical protein
MRRSWRSTAAIAVTGISVGLASMIAGPVGAAGAVTVTPARAALPAATSYSVDGALTGVAAAAVGNAWAVGYSGTTVAPKILMLHWNGSAWSKVPGKQLKLNGSAGELSAITVVNAKDAYAVGYTGSPLGTTRTLLLHWNGSTWGTVTSPAAVSGGALTAVAVTAKGGWAVGYYATNAASLSRISVLSGDSVSIWSRIVSAAGESGGAPVDQGIATSPSILNRSSVESVCHGYRALCGHGRCGRVRAGSSGRADPVPAV